VTDELLALLGATSAPSKQSDSIPTNETAMENYGNGVVSGNGNDSISHVNDTQGNSLLADLVNAEDNSDEVDEPMAFDFHNDSYDDGDDESFNLDDDLANVDNNLSEEGNNNDLHDASNQGTLKETTVQITGLTLPSAGETSSEDEEDSLAE
jgi:hypothetical protein